MSHFSDSRLAVLDAMRCVDREAAMRELWGNGFGRLLNYLAVACAPQDVGIDILRLAVQRTSCPTAIVTGQRCSGADIDGGTDSPVLRGVAAAAEVLAPTSWLGGGMRLRGDLPALYIHFSGGVNFLWNMGETPGPDMARQFSTMTRGHYENVVSADSYALNTGDQARVLAGILFAHGVRRVVFVHAVDHIARFAATVMAALEHLIDAENHRLNDLISMRRNAVNPGAFVERVGEAYRYMPKVYFVSTGAWNDRDPRRGRGDGILRAQEAFGPRQTPDEAVHPGKLLGCEYADRFQEEQDPYRSINFACPALSPGRMLDLVQSWVKDYLGYVAST